MGADSFDDFAKKLTREEADLGFDVAAFERDELPDLLGWTSLGEGVRGTSRAVLNLEYYDEHDH